MKHIFFIGILLVTNLIFSQKLKVQGNWNKTFDVSDIYQAGLDYMSFYESKDNQSKIDITPIPNSKYNKKFMRFKVFINKEDLDWHPNIKLFVKVSSNTHGNSTGTIYQEIKDYPSLFFETIGQQKKIPIKYKVSGLSVTLPAENYSVEIVYTVLNL